MVRGCESLLGCLRRGGYFAAVAAFDYFRSNDSDRVGVVIGERTQKEVVTWSVATNAQKISGHNAQLLLAIRFIGARDSMI